MKKQYTTILLLIISISLFGQFATLEVDGNESSLTHDNILINQNLNQSTASNAMAASLFGKRILVEDFLRDGQHIQIILRVEFQLVLGFGL